MLLNFAGLCLQVCNYRGIFELTNAQKYCQIHYAYVQKIKYFVLKGGNKHWHIEIYNTCGYK